MRRSTPLTPRTLALLLICAAALSTIPGVAQTTQDDLDARAAAMGLHETNGRLQIPALTHPLKLEELNDIPIQLHGFKVRFAVASWRYDRGNGSLGPQVGLEDVTVLYHSDGSAYVKLTPETLGKSKIHIDILFEDGGTEDGFVTSDVVYPDRKPEEFIVARMVTGYTKNTGTVLMDLSTMSGEEGIEPIALYKDALSPAHIPAKDVKFKLITATESDPPISIDEATGIITARHIGHALIQTTFQDFSVLTCVDVRENANPRGRGTVCSELVPAGMTAPLP